METIDLLLVVGPFLFTTHRRRYYSKPEHTATTQCTVAALCRTFLYLQELPFSAACLNLYMVWTNVEWKSNYYNLTRDNKDTTPGSTTQFIHGNLLTNFFWALIVTIKHLFVFSWLLAPAFTKYKKFETIAISTFRNYFFRLSPIETCGSSELRRHVLLEMCTFEERINCAH